ncbi:MAG: SDR family oxidoreductase [Cytophagales bacterium]|nr:SDR family oxidoreductase [Cytophagales bacterium]
MGKHYLIVGASSGIGLQLTNDLLEQGHQVTALSRTEGNWTKKVNFISYDINEPKPIELKTDAIDGFVYCPGSINLKPFHRLKRVDFQADLDINVLGAVEILQQVLPFLKKAEEATIVFFSTVAVGQGMGFHTSIAMAKGAVEGLTRSLAAELAPKIRVNCIAPSIVNTPLASKLLSTPEKIEASAKRHPLASVGTPKDIAGMTSFLLSDQSQWITGQVLHIDGGLSSVKMM